MRIGKSYLVANAIIRAEKIDGRKIVDEKDVEDLGLLFKNRLNRLGYEIVYFNDIIDEVFNEEIYHRNFEGTMLYVSLPDVSCEELKEMYRDNLPFGVGKIFNSLDADENLKRSKEDLFKLRFNEQAIIDECPAIIPTKDKPKVFMKSYVSEK